MTLTVASGLLTGCSATTTEARRVESPARVRLVRPEPEASLGGEFRYEAGAVVGRLAWQNACRRERVREIKEQNVAVTRLMSKPASYTVIAIGAAVLVGGVYAIADAGAGEHADYRSCSDTSNDECKSPRELMTEAGVALIAGGLTFGGYGVAGLVAKPDLNDVGAPRVVGQDVKTVEPEAACGKPAALAGVTLSVTAPGGEPSFGTVDEHGAVRIVLDEGALAAGGAQVTVEVAAVPEALSHAIPPGTVVGEVSLPEPALAEVAPPARRGAKKGRGRAAAAR